MTADEKIKMLEKELAYERRIAELEKMLAAERLRTAAAPAYIPYPVLQYVPTALPYIPHRPWWEITTITGGISNIPTGTFTISDCTYNGPMTGLTLS